jgi:hypothetical protein
LCPGSYLERDQCDRPTDLLTPTIVGIRVSPSTTSLSTRASTIVSVRPQGLAETISPALVDEPTRVFRLESALPEEDLAVLDGIWHTYGTRRGRPRAPRKIQRSTEVPETFAPEVNARADAMRNFVRTEGRLGPRPERPWTTRARTSYFRDEYAFGDTITAGGIENIMNSEALVEAARKLYGMPLVLPYIAYGNILLPGQELGIHTDVPAFRGADRNVVPLWLLVAMRHSGLFERWRIPVATAIVFIGGRRAGGQFAYYPCGSDAPVARVDSVQGTALMFDGDTVFHGVDKVSGDDSGIRSVGRGERMRISNKGDRIWHLQVMPGRPDQKPTLRRHFAYGSDDLRFSMSWKAYCFADEAERSVWAKHEDDLDRGVIVETLVDGLCESGALSTKEHGLSDTDLAYLMMDTFIRFPEPTRN